MTISPIISRWALELGVVAGQKPGCDERILVNAAMFDFSLTLKIHARLGEVNEDSGTPWYPTGVHRQRA